MTPMRSRKLAAAAVLALALPFGLAAQGARQPNGRPASSQEKTAEQYRIFTTALAAVEQEYVEKLESEKLVYGAIEGMLRTLDPHSSFLDPRAYAQMRERQQGQYFGIGISIVSIDGEIRVTSVFEQSPAYRAGIRRGDVIAKIKGQLDSFAEVRKARLKFHADWPEGPGHEGLDERSGRQGAEGAERHDRAVRHPAPRSRHPGRLHGRARSGHHPHGTRVVHAREQRRLRAAAGFLRDVE